MNIRDIFDRVLVESGQFIIPSSDIELDQDKFKVLVNAVLGVYNKYCPIVKKCNIDISAGRDFVFTKDTISLTGELIGIPDLVTDITPVRISGISPFYLREFQEQKSKYLNAKANWPWSYSLPHLDLPLQAQYDIETTHYRHP